MTRNRRRKVEIRLQRAATGGSYTAARWQVPQPSEPLPPATDKVAVLPPMASWNRPITCRLWAKLVAEHGPLIAVNISQGDRWWALDDLARSVAGALQEGPPEQRGLWLAFGTFYVTKAEHLDGIVAKLDGAGALRRLTVRSVPTGQDCDHATCRRRRGEPPLPAQRRPVPATPAARPAVELGPALTLAEVMEAHPTLQRFGFGAYFGTPVEQRAQEVADGREQLRAREDVVLRIRGWLRTNIAPVKTPTVGSYGMKHVVESATGRYVTNGELIAAALMAGYPWKGPSGPNALFGMSKRDVDRARAAQ
ncbi:hypothetical protein FBZ33_4098 [Micromonospora sp. A202]|uniref:hypothetical protein n=1 Tax=Micromonospora sp. A202 TaxID=2572899 RepID=UPI00116B34C4|nr:hypothetical protein [Micromonospora sp. A202]TQJ23782.1 hypothetical protein FBZ33_4098 [Micromonospora sp. A202]